MSKASIRREFVPKLRNTTSTAFSSGTALFEHQSEFEEADVERLGNPKLEKEYQRGPVHILRHCQHRTHATGWRKSSTFLDLFQSASEMTSSSISWVLFATKFGTVRTESDFRSISNVEDQRVSTSRHGSIASLCPSSILTVSNIS